MRVFLLMVLAFLGITKSYSQVSFGETSLFNDSWLFNKDDAAEMSSPNYDDSKWRRLELPHDWSIEGLASPTLASCTGYLPAGVAWYRKHFDIADLSERAYIYFEGVYNRSEVYLNGHLLGKRPNGYISFMYDMTPYLKEKNNVLAVRVDHSRIADSRWYTGSGIYRDVWLIRAGDVHFAQWGLGWKATSISNSSAQIDLDVEVEKHNAQSSNLVVKSTLFDADGKVVS
ncbi:MAG: beta galactosidase jelly roll domain-containing protein, partial [Prevotella sp.]|nr:beta galactosidase jelly roll domain-containing protein [Prevotella sp.]